MIFENEKPTYADVVERFQWLLGRFLSESGILQSGVSTSDGLSDNVDKALVLVAAAVQDGGDVQAAVDNAWSVFYTDFPEDAFPGS